MKILVADKLIKAEYSGKGYIGKRIQKCREESGMTKNEVAEILNVTPATVHRWKSGVRMPDLATILKLANIFGMKVDELIKDKPFS